MKVSTKSKFLEHNWNWHLKNAVRDPNRLASELEISLSDFKSDFPLLVPFPYLNRIQKGDLNDPLLLQVLPKVEEENEVSGYILDPLKEQKRTNLPKGLIQKYRRRALIIAAAACGINCRYCFRRHFPYDQARLDQQKWRELLEHVSLDKTLREIIFSDERKRVWLENLLHPLIEDEISKSMKLVVSQYVILESPLLLETDQHKFVNRILVVDVSPEVQLKRTLSRDGGSEATVKAIINSQLTRVQRLSMADDIIFNEQDLQSVRVELKTLHQSYLSMAIEK